MADSGDCEAHTKKERSVRFSPVADVREYSRQINGSGGVPYRGGYPLGLGPTYVEKKEPIISAKMKMDQMRSGHIFMPLTEKQRKKLLRQYDPSCPKNDSSNRMELDKLRLSRIKNAGCSCTFGRCNSETCECYAIGLPCIEGSCSCMRCMNPYEKPPCEDEELDDFDEDGFDMESEFDEDEDSGIVLEDDDEEEEEDLETPPPKKKRSGVKAVGSAKDSKGKAKKSSNVSKKKQGDDKKARKSKKRKLVWVTQKE